MLRDDTPCPWCGEPSGHVAGYDALCRSQYGGALRCVSCDHKLAVIHHEDKIGDGGRDTWTLERAAR